MPPFINTVSQKGFSITNKSQNTAEITIYSEIGSSFWGDGISAKTFSEELKKIPESVTNINVRINSPGGDVFDGITIYNRLKQHKAKVTTYIDGVAASIASIIALAGDEVIMGEGALMMIHKPAAGIYGDSNEHLELIQRLDDVEEQLINIYKKKTKLDRVEIQTMLANTTWMNADEAINLGFANSVMDEDLALDIAACIKNKPWINKMPDMSQSKINLKIKNFKTDVEKFLARNKRS